MGRKCKIPKNLVVLTTPMVEKPPKIYHAVEAFYLDHLLSLCARADTPTSLVEGKSLDEHACYVRHRLRESRTRGCPDSRTIIIDRTPRL